MNHAIAERPRRRCGLTVSGLPLEVRCGVTLRLLAAWRCPSVADGRCSLLPRGSDADPCRLLDYIAGALLIPYAALLGAAYRLRHDLEALATRFGVSFEHVSHRLSTLQRPGARGVPFAR